MKHYLTARDCTALIDAYFVRIKGKYYNLKGKKVYTITPEPPTFTGLAAALGFNSLADFEEYLIKGANADIVKRAKLKVEIEYEKRLHQPSATAAIFALKTMGWKEKAADTPEQLTDNPQIEIVISGPHPAATEKDVLIDE
ncbi:hypothetical protein FFF34_009400 [Inquilinus sp. KBS0705]|nr:hypothetical protein FFF34_009400 [Inquilinus sp. KBS0705]